MLKYTLEAAEKHDIMHCLIVMSVTARVFMDIYWLNTKVTTEQMVTVNTEAEILNLLYFKPYDP